MLKDPRITLVFVVLSGLSTGLTAAIPHLEQLPDEYKPVSVGVSALAAALTAALAGLGEAMRQITPAARRRAASFALAGILVAGSFGLTACSQKDVERFASVSVEGQRGVSDGIAVARALREAGKVSPEKNLQLARRARTVVSLHLSSVNLALEAGTDGVEAKSLAEQIEAVIAEADRLIADGTVELDGTTKVVFDLSFTLGRNRLQSVADQLRSKPGVRIPVGEEARAKLNESKAAADRNLKALDEAIRRLSAAPAPAN